MSRFKGKIGKKSVAVIVVGGLLLGARATGVITDEQFSAGLQWVISLSSF